MVSAPKADRSPEGAVGRITSLVGEDRTRRILDAFADLLEAVVDVAPKPEKVTPEPPPAPVVNGNEYIFPTKTIELAPGLVVDRPPLFDTARQYLTWLLEAAGPYPIDGKVAKRIDDDHNLWKGTIGWDDAAYRDMLSKMRHGGAGVRKDPSKARDIHLGKATYTSEKNKAKIKRFGGRYIHLSFVYRGKVQ